MADEVERAQDGQPDPPGEQYPEVIAGYPYLQFWAGGIYFDLFKRDTGAAGGIISPDPDNARKTPLLNELPAEKQEAAREWARGLPRVPLLDGMAPEAARGLERLDAAVLAILGDQTQPAQAEAAIKPADIPDKFPQQTWPEAKALMCAFSDSSTLRFWKPTVDERSLKHKRPGSSFEVEFDPTMLPDIWGDMRPETLEDMRQFIQKRGMNGVLTLQIALYCALKLEHELIAIDDFVRMLFDTRSREDYVAKRAWVWETLCMIFTLKAYGKRWGTYKDPATKRPIELTLPDEPFIAPSPGSRLDANGQPDLWASSVPVFIGFTMGKWGVEARKNPRTLQYFGNLPAILDIPAGRLTGAWARSIMLGVNQICREGAKNVTDRTHERVNRDGETKLVTTAKWPRAFTRRQLLIDLFPPDKQFSVMAILDGPNPGRARTTWAAAIRELKGEKKEKKLICYYKELEPLPPKRKNWQEGWLDQPLDIRPNRESIQAAIEIRTAHKKAMARLAKRKKTTPDGNKQA